MWRTACLEWLAAASPRAGQADRPLPWRACESLRQLPFGEYGGVLDVLRQDRRYLELIPICPEESRTGVCRTGKSDQASY
jgi:hypothetical protein